MSTADTLDRESEDGLCGGFGRDVSGDAHYHRMRGITAATSRAAHFTAVGDDGTLCGHPHGSIAEACRCALSAWGRDGIWEIVPYDGSGRPFPAGEFGRAAAEIVRETGGLDGIGDGHITDLAVLMAEQGEETAACPPGGRDRLAMGHFLRRRARIGRYVDGSWRREYEAWTEVEAIVDEMTREG